MSDYTPIKITELTLKQLSELSGSEDIQIVQNGVNYRIKSEHLINNVVANLTSTSSTDQLAANQGAKLKSLNDWQNSADGIIFAYSSNWVLSTIDNNVEVTIPECYIMEINSSTPILTTGITGTIIDNGGIVVSKTGSTYVYSFVDDLSTIIEGDDFSKWVIVKNINGALYTRIPSVWDSIKGGTDSFDYIDLIPQSTVPNNKEGRIYYDNTKKTIILFDDITGTSIELSYEIPVRVINNTGSTVTNGQAVYISGASNMKPTIELADCGVYEKSRVIGVATHDISNGGEGKIVYFGQINDLNTSSYSLGDILYLKKDIPGEYDTTFPDGGQFVVRIGTVINVSETQGAIQLNISSSDYTDETVKQTGFPDRYNVKLDFNDTTRVFTIEPVDGIKTRYYEKGIKYIITDSQTITLPNEYGLFLIYYNGAILSYIKNPNDGQVDTIIRNNPTVSYILYNDDISENVYFANELHNSIGYGEVNHSYNHFTRGAQYISGLSLTGFNLGTGTLNSDAQFGIEGGGITDEDLPTFGTAKASTLGLPIYWIEDVAGVSYVRRKTQAGYSVIQLATGERLRYNNLTTGTLDLVDNKDYVCTHIFACNAYNDAYMQVAVCGQAEYNTAGLARTGALNEIFNIQAGILPTPEFTPIGTIIFQTSEGYSNDIKARIVQSEDPDTGDFVDWIDWRGYGNSGSGGGSGEAIIEFSDEQFKVFNDIDVSKIMRFDISAISTGATRTLTMPDKNGTVALLSDISGGSDFSTIEYLTVADITARDALILGTDFSVGDYVKITNGGNGYSVIQRYINAAWQDIDTDFLINQNSEASGAITTSDVSVHKILDKNGAIILDIKENGSLRCGYNAGNGVDSGDLIAIGWNSGASLINVTNGHNSVLVGAHTGQNTTTGVNNVFIGEFCGYQNVTGSRNTAVGSLALEGEASQNSNDNTAIGYQAGRNITTGSANVLLGGSAGQGITTAKQNVIIGLAGYAGTITGDANVLVGDNAGTDLTSGIGNCLVGKNAGRDNSTGNYNVAMGYQAFGAGNTTNTTGDNNVYLGLFAGYINNLGRRNIAIGSDVYKNAIDGDENTIIGYLSAQNLIDGDNNVIIGRRAELKTPNGSNLLAIGNNATENLIDGDFANKTLKHNAAVNFFTGALTDGAPTNAEINAIITNPICAGYEAIIKDTDGSGAMYKVIYDGTGWHYTQYTAAI